MESRFCLPVENMERTPFRHPLRGLSAFTVTVTDIEARQLLVPSPYVKHNFEKLPSTVSVVTPDGKCREVELSEIDGLPYLSDGWPLLRAEYGVKEQEMLLFTYWQGSPLFVYFLDAEKMSKPVGGLVEGDEGILGACHVKTPTTGSARLPTGSPRSPTEIIRTEPINRRSVNSKPKKGWNSSSRAELVAPRLLNFGETDNDNLEDTQAVGGIQYSMKYSRLPLPWRQRNSDNTKSVSTTAADLNSYQQESKSSNLVALFDNAKWDEVDTRKKRRYAGVGEHATEESLSGGLAVNCGVEPLVNTIYKVGIALPVYDLPKTNCWITVPKDIGTSFDGLLISPMFALENLTAGKNKMVFTFDGVLTWKVVCSVADDWAMLTTGWKEFVIDNNILGGDSFVISAYPAIRHGWMVNKIMCSGAAN